MEKWKQIKVGTSLNYEVSTKGKVRNTKTNNTIGFKGSDGYMHVIINDGVKSKNIRIHTLVWGAYGKGKPNKKMVIDHINRDRSDNRIENLQLISFRKNVHKDTDTQTGVVGVHFSNAKQRYRAQISLNNVRYSLGYRKTIKECEDLYHKALLDFNTKGITPDYLKEKLPANKKRCTSCKKVLAINFFDEYKTSRGNLSKRAKCQKCYKEYKAFHDAKYRRKL